MLPKPSPTIVVTPEELVPIFSDIFSRAALQSWLVQEHLRFLWRKLTPLILLWGFVFQRLNSDHTTDAVVSHLHTGAADTLDRADPHKTPLSARLHSESTSAYCQARKRLPLGLIQWAVKQTQPVIEETMPLEQRTWHGLPVRFLDGTGFSLAPTPDLQKTYGHAKNQHGEAYWITVRSLAAFCSFTGMLIGYAEGPETTSEQAMVRSVMEQDDAHALYIGDSNFGIYHVVQVAHALRQHLIVRMTPQRFRALLRTAHQGGPLRSGQSWNVDWAYQPQNTSDATLPCDPVPGQLVYVRLERDGFRPKDLYLFTTVLDATISVDEIIAAYGLRWQVEVDYCHLKTTLDMESFTAKSTAMFRKELAAGLLTYNLICALMAQAAHRVGKPPTALSFSRCMRRIRDTLLHGIPQWVAREHSGSYLLDRLAGCLLPHQPTKVAHEPRKQRHRRQKFPSLRGSRKDARRSVLDELGYVEATSDPQSPETVCHSEGKKRAA